MGGRWGRNMGVGGRIMPPPKDVYILIPGTCEYGPLHGQRDFADVIKLRISRWRDYSGFSRGTAALEDGGRRIRVTARLENATLLALKLEEEATSQGMGQLLGTRKGKRTESPLKLPERTQSCQHLDISPAKPVSDI